MKFAGAGAALIAVMVTLSTSCSKESPAGGSNSATSASCGNGQLDVGEACDPSAAPCPVSCDDGDACTVDQLSGSADACTAACTATAIRGCAAGDGCCKAGCDGTTDADCLAPPGAQDGASGGASGTGGTGETPDNDVGAGGTDGAANPGDPVVLDCDEGAIPGSPNTLGVDVAGAEQVVHKEIFGVLMETLGRNINGGIYVGTGSAIPNTQGIRDDIIEAFREAGVGAVQWPGGCAANGFDWKANLGSRSTMDTDLFMEFSKQIDAEPFLVGRPRPEFAQSNRDWVEYVNDNPDHPEWQLKYFKVGNEVWGCGGELGDDNGTYESWYNAHYDLLSTPVNGKALFLVGATGGVWTVNPGSDNWLTRMLSPGHIADKIDGIEIHDYLYYPDDIPSVGFSDAEYYTIVDKANEGQIAPRVRDVKTILDRFDPGGRIMIMEDEWGDWLREFSGADIWFQQNTLMDAISAAEHLHVFMEHSDRVLMGGMAQSTNVIHSLFLTNSSSGGSDLVRTPTFYVFKLFAPHHTAGAQWIPNTLDSETLQPNGRAFPSVSSAATVNDAGAVHVSLVNVDLEKERDVTVTIDGGAGGYRVTGAQVISGAAKDSYNDFGQAERVNIQPLEAASYEACGRKLAVTLPAKSVVMFSLEPL